MKSYRSDPWPIVAATIMAAFYFGTSWHIASHRPFWFDEISTVLIARLNGYAGVWDALSHAVDLVPPAYFILARVFDQWLGPAEIAARIPSVVAMAVGMVVVFDCTRRLTNGLHGLIAMSLLGCSLLPYYGYEARPYSLYFMVVALSLWVWIHAKDEKLSSAILFGIIFFLSFTVHYYAAFSLAAYAAAMVLDRGQWRARLRKFVAGCAGVLCAALVIQAQILAARQAAPGFWAPPSLSKLGDVYLAFFPHAVLLIVVIILWIVVAGTGRATIPAPAMGAGERAGWLFLLIPCVGYLVARIGTNAFYDRYFIGMLPGIVLAVSCLLWRHFKSLPRVSVGILLILVALGVQRQIRVAQNPEAVEPPSAVGQAALMRQMRLLEDTFQDDGRQYVVLSADGILGLEARYYARRPQQYFFFIDEEPGLIARIMVNLGRYSPMPFWRLDDLKMHAREAVLINPSNKDLNQIKDAGFQLETRFVDPITLVYPR